MEISKSCNKLLDTNNRMIDFNADKKGTILKAKKVIETEFSIFSRWRHTSKGNDIGNE